MSVFGADSLFGISLCEQFAESDNVPAPPVLIRCMTELEKRLQETGAYCCSRVLADDPNISTLCCCNYVFVVD